MEVSKQTKQTHRGRGLAATLAFAAAFTGAALLYLRRRGVAPKDAAKKVSSRARTAAGILKGESKAAYQEVRRAVVDRLIASETKPTRATAFAVVKEVIADLRRHGVTTSAELAAVAKQLRLDWRELTEAAQKQRDA